MAFILCDILAQEAVLIVDIDPYLSIYAITEGAREFDPYLIFIHAHKKCKPICRRHNSVLSKISFCLPCHLFCSTGFTFTGLQKLLSFALTKF